MPEPTKLQAHWLPAALAVEDARRNLHPVEYEVFLSMLATLVARRVAETIDLESLAQ